MTDNEIVIPDGGANEGESAAASAKKKWYKAVLEDNPVGRWFYRHRYGLLIFFLPIIIMYLVYAFFGVHPFGEGSVLVLDLNGQYVSYYEMLRDAIWSDHSLIYSWSRNLSGEAMGIFGYYLASPFMWIIVLLPRTMMLGAIELMQLLKIGCCALSFAYYLRHSKKASSYMQVIFSVTYALMTYIVVELMNPMWIDGMIWLPLIVIGIERLIDEGKMLGLTVSLTVMFISHFYIGYMLAIFSVIYFIYYLFSRPGHAIAPHFVKSGFKFFGSAIISALTSSIILIPVYFSLKLGKLDFSTPDFTPKNQFDVFSLLTKLFTNSYDTVHPEGLPMIACGTLVVLLIPLFFLNTKIKPKEKISSALLALVIIGSMYISTADIAWHGFQVPNWLNYRYSFTLCFIMIIMAFRALENIDGVSYKELCLTAFAWVVTLAVLNHQNHAEFYLFETVWLSVLMIIIFTTLLYLTKKYKNLTMKIILAVFICIEIFENSMYTVYSIDCDVVYSTYTSYQDYFIEGRRTVDMVEDLDSGLYRMEKTFHRTVNDPMGMGFKGISHSSSTMNTPVLKMLKSLGLGMRGHYTKYIGSTILTDSLLGIKYIMHKPGDTTPTVDPKEENRQMYQNELKRPYKGYKLILTEEDTDSKISVYENPYALSVGYMADNKISDVNLDSKSPFENHERLLHGLLGSGSSGVYSRIYSYYSDTVNCSTATTGDHIMYTTTIDNKDSYIEFTLTVPDENPIYAFFPTNYQRKCNIWVKADSWDIVNYAFVNYFFTDEYYSILNLGTYEPGEKIKIRMTLANQEAIFSDVLFYSLNMDALEDVISQLRQGEWKIDEHTDTYLSGSVDAQKDGILFTTIPYEPGWTITVDGNEVEPVKLLDSLIGIEMPAGTHTVTMKFWPKYLTLAIVVSLFGLSLIALLFVWEFKDSKILKKIIAKTR